MIDPTVYIKNYLVQETQAYHKTLMGQNDLYDGMRLALANFERTGLPDKKNEKWKYTPISSKMIPHRVGTAPMIKAAKEDIEPFLLKEGFKIIFINGHFDPEESILPKNVTLTHISTKKNDDVRRDQLQEVIKTDPSDPFENLNVAGLHEAYVMEIEANQFIDTPISILHLTSHHAKEYGINTRLVVRAKKYARATIMESFGHFGEGEPVYMVNSYTDFDLEEGAYIEHVKNQRDSLNAIHVGKLKANVAKYAYFNSFSFTTGGKVARNNIEINLNDTEATSSVNGLFSIKEDQHCDNDCEIHHNAPMSHSEQLFKGVASANGHGVFTGKIIMHRNAQQCTSSQLSRNMLLSHDAVIDARPQLEIYADDVKAGHGATVGRINDDEMFYLQTRGIPKPKAEKLLCKAFAKDALQKIKSELVKEKLYEALDKRLDYCLNCELRLCDED